MSLMDDFFTQIIRYISNDSQYHDPNQNIIKQHTEKLNQNGDVGFSVLLKAWKSYLKQSDRSCEEEKLFDESDGNFQENFIKVSQKWAFQIEKVQFMHNRCALFINRTDCFGKVINIVLQNEENYGRRNQDAGKNCYSIVVNVCNDKDLTGYRCLLIRNVLRNLLKTIGYPVIESDNQNMEKVSNVLITHSRNKTLTAADNKENDENNTDFLNKMKMNRQGQKIVCGEIRDENKLLAADYIRRRSMDMEKMAETKYGDNVENAIIYNFEDLGSAGTAFDLLKIKHTNVISIDNLIKQSKATKGAAFVLYNVARLQSIFNTFDDKVRSGYYQRLPDIDKIDFSLLREEEEWQLLYVYILGYPTALERSIGSIETGQIALHYLCNFLSNFVGLFSAYYHRVKILTDNLPHLMSTMYARIYLLMAIRSILLKSLLILEIKPVDQM